MPRDGLGPSIHNAICVNLAPAAVSIHGWHLDQRRAVATQSTSDPFQDRGTVWIRRLIPGLQSVRIAISRPAGCFYKPVQHRTSKIQLYL